MSFYCSEYLKRYLNNYTQENCNIWKTLLENETVSLKQLRSESKNMKASKLLLILDKLYNFNLVSKSIELENNVNITYYEIDIDNCVGITRCHLLMGIIQNSHGPTAGKIYELFCSKGNVSVVNVIAYFGIVKESEKLKEYINEINKLVNENILEISPIFADKFNINMNEICLVNYKDIEVNDLTKRKRKNDDFVDASWNRMYRINMDKMNTLLRNSIILEYLKSNNKRIECVDFMKCVLERYEHCDVSYGQPISLSVIRKLLKSWSDDTFEDVLYELANSNPNMIYLNIQTLSTGQVVSFESHRVIEQIIQNDISKLIENEFGDFGVRLFNYLILHPYTEETVLEKIFIMDKSKWSSLILNMLNYSYISKAEVSKGFQFNPDSLDVLYYVDFQKMIRNIKEDCYKSLLEILIIRDEIKNRKNVLVNKIHNVKYVVKNGTTADSNGDISVITESEETDLKNTYSKLKSLARWEKSIHNTLILSEKYLEYKKYNNF